MNWLKMRRNGDTTLQVVYRGPLTGPYMRLRYGFDGWQEPIAEVKLECLDLGLAISEPIPVAGHLTLDCVVTNGIAWDNNTEVDYRLWIGFAPFDAHMHVSGKGAGALGLGGLQTAMASAGIRGGLVSWIDNHSLDQINLPAVNLYPLVWVRPGETTVAEVRARLATGAVGLKLHPVVDDFPADTPDLDPYLEVAEEAGVPVCCHSAPQEADPDLIRRLAERFPKVPVLFYHVYLGPYEGRTRAVAHVLEQPNLFLETSWCGWEQVQWMVEQVGAARVMFGSDASVDGHHHFCRRPPNVEGRETYNDGLLNLTRALGPEAMRKVMGDNARQLFGVGQDRVF